MSNYPYVNGPDPEDDPALAALLQDLYARRNNAICCTLVYGSCLRSGDIYDGLLDLYLVCDDYRAAYGAGPLAIGNWLLPPNVFYAEQIASVTAEDSTENVPEKTAETNAEIKTLRAKVTVISIQDFERGCSRAWFESYIWGRFAQPTRILEVRDDATRERIENTLLNAASTLLQRAIPVLPHSGSVAQLWEQALGLSYATELRTERSGRAAELAQSSSEFYTAITQHHAPSLGHGFALEDGQNVPSYRASPTAWSTFLCRMAWGARRVQGKLLSIMRLLKGLFTFEGGLDYIAWKLERHSGEKIVVPDNVRRAPLIHLWGFFWGLYKRGIFK